jgi:ribosomal protein S18 acetylase RimI-like enzyme
MSRRKDRLATMRIEVRRYQVQDHDAVLALAPRLTEGVARWRRPEAVLTAVTGWVSESLSRAAEPARFVFVAEVAGEVAGFVSGEERTHWSGDTDLYVGELVVARECEGQGVGRSLMEAVTGLAEHSGVGRITLETGAANEQALAFYHRLGFVPEDIRLTMVR